MAPPAPIPHHIWFLPLPERRWTCSVDGAGWNRAVHHPIGTSVRRKGREPHVRKRPPLSHSRKPRDSLPRRFRCRFEATLAPAALHAMRRRKRCRAPHRPRPFRESDGDRTTCRRPADASRWCRQDGTRAAKGGHGCAETASTAAQARLDDGDRVRRRERVAAPRAAVVGGKRGGEPSRRRGGAAEDGSHRGAGGDGSAVVEGRRGLRPGGAVADAAQHRRRRPAAARRTRVRRGRDRQRSRSSRPSTASNPTGSPAPKPGGSSTRSPATASPTKTR